jgi:hypothetical protein
MAALNEIQPTGPAAPPCEPIPMAAQGPITFVTAGAEDGRVREAAVIRAILASA